MNTNPLTVSDWPVARNDDPATSFEAGENQAAREASEVAVLAALQSSQIGMSDGEIEFWDRMFGDPFTRLTPQRLRTARAQLVRSGQVVAAGRRENASPTGRAAMTWKLANR